MAPSVNKRNTEVKKGVWAERVVCFKPIIFHSWRGLWVWEREREREAERSYINPEQLHVSLTLPFSLRFKSSSFFSLSSNLFLFLFLFPFVTNLAREERGEFVVRIFFFFFFWEVKSFQSLLLWSERQIWQRMLEFSPWISTSLLPVFSRWLTLSLFL